MLKQNVFIIGAGPSGLVAVKEALEAGLNPLCVDAKSSIGGLFNESYNELYTTTTNMFMAFSDFPPKEKLKYWSKEEYLQYLEDYATHFSLRNSIKLNTTVKECVLDKHTGRWKIKISNDTPAAAIQSDQAFRKNAEPSFTYDADYLLVATGTNQIPNILDFPKLDPSVKVVHSVDFTDAAALCEGKKVLVIGNGESAADVAAQSTDVAEKVTLWSRRDFSLGPRFISSFLTDGAYDERQTLLDQDDLDLRPHDMLEGISNSRILSRLPLAVFSAAFNAMLSDVTSWHGKNSPAGILAKIDKKNFRPDFFALDTSAPTKSGGVITHAAAFKGLDIFISPRAEIKGKKAHFEEVTFKGKSERKKSKTVVDFDLIILCTGFKFNFDWIKIEDGNQIEANPRKWFKHCFPADLGDKIGFLGYARPAQGGIPQTSELLARYVSLLIKGDRTLPKNYDIKAILEGRAEEETFYRVPHALALVEYAPYVSSIARLIGCEPSVPLLSPSRYVKFWTLPMWTCFFRLEGPGANPNVCWEVVDKYRVRDTLVPMPLFIIYLAFGMMMQPLMIIEYIFGSTVLDHALPPSQVLPRFYKWRVGGHFHQLSGNELRYSDLIYPSFGWFFTEVLLFYTVDDAVTLASLHVAIASSLAGVAFLYMYRNRFVQFGRKMGIVKPDTSGWLDETGHTSTAYSTIAIDSTQHTQHTYGSVTA